ncbi:lytic transglycosylase domain-containing protein [Micromonospora inyonensis]|uniref:lytic transglycosylase domain-containing protein n=1 Tax=Micromonospora inyonensis TaxID=47866 RepID=UPI000B82FD44|nr:lytic murein transglycosylase [Micromonospora inyonensis]
MVDGEDSLRSRPLRPAAPPDGPLATSGAADEPARVAGAVPRPRTPVPPDALRPTVPAPGNSPPPGTAPAETTAPVAPTADPTTTTGPDVKTGPDDKTGPDAKSDPDDTTGPDAKSGPDDTTTSDTGSEPGRATRRRYRVPYAHAVRLPPPRQAAAGAVRATRAWSKRPSGRFALSAAFLLGLVSATAAAGALLVPATAPAPRPVAGSGSPDASVGPTTVPSFPGGVVPPGTPLPGGVNPGGVPLPTGRPADALADWARVTGEKAGIPQVAMQAYGYAELVLARTTPNCSLSWTTLAAIGYVESRHGAANGAKLMPDGQALPEIIGDPLDGNGGRQRILDSDRGRLDRDLTYDRAVGPMQFIPTTWQEIGADADNDGVKNPHDLDDAALAAGSYLCKGGRKMTVPGDWWGAILSYNDVRRYAQDVFYKANAYGVTSRG